MPSSQPVDAPVASAAEARANSARANGPGALVRRLRTGTSAPPWPGRTAWRSRWRGRRDRRPWRLRAYVRPLRHTLRMRSQGRYPARRGRLEPACTSSDPQPERRRWPTDVGDTARRRIPEATVARLPLYYRALLEAAEHEVATISSERLAELAGVNAAKVRKDLSYLGSYGTRGVGYDVEYLAAPDLPRARPHPGLAGRRSSASATSATRSPTTAASAPGASGSSRSSTPTRPRSASAVGDLDDRAHRRPRRHRRASASIAIGIIATPRRVAQDVADRLVAAGVALDPELRAGGAHRARRRVAAQGRPRDRAADPVLLPTARAAPTRADGRVTGRREPDRAPGAPGLAGLPGEPARARPARASSSAPGASPPARSSRCSTPAPTVAGRRARGRRRGAGAGPTPGRLALHERGVRAGRPRRRLARDHRHRRSRRSTRAVLRGRRGAPGLGQQRRRPGQLLVHADVGGPPGRPRGHDRHRRPQPGARRLAAAALRRGDRPRVRDPARPALRGPGSAAGLGAFQRGRRLATGLRLRHPRPGPRRARRRGEGAA